MLTITKTNSTVRIVDEDSSISFVNPKIFWYFTNAILILNIEGSVFNSPVANVSVAGDVPGTVEGIETALSTLFNGAGGSAGTTFKSYVALLTQTGTNPPVATVLQNSIGAVITWNYFDVGSFRGVGPADIFPENRTAIFINQNQGTHFNAAFRGGNEIGIDTTDFSNNGVNGVLSEVTLEIRIYEQPIE